MNKLHATVIGQPSGKKLIIYAGFILIASLMLTGCASGPKFTAAPQPAPGKALVYVYRNSSIVGAAGYDKVYVNDDYLADIRSGGYASCEVSPGSVPFYVTPRVVWGVALGMALLTNFQKKQYEKLRIDVEAGKSYYVNLYVAFVGHQMRLMDEAKGAKEIRGLHHITGGDDK